MARARVSAAPTSAAKRHSAIQEAFIRRTIHAIERMATQADEAVLIEAMAAPTDVGTLAKVLVDFGATGTAIAEIDPDAVNLAREIEHRDAVMQRAGGMVSAADVGKLLQMSRQGVDKRRRSKALLAVRQGGDWFYPRAQFHESEAIPGLAFVIRGFAASGPWVTLEFLVTGDGAIGGLTPRDAMLKGAGPRDQVMALVRGEERGEGFA